MEPLLSGLVAAAPFAVLLLILVGSIGVLVKGADILVHQAVALSIGWGMSKMLVGATIVSLGTTLPETAVSVFAAVRGSPGLALGNAVGSIIANTGLILGLAVLVGPIPVDQRTVRRQSWIKFGSAVLLVLVCIPLAAPQDVFTVGGRLPRAVGVVFLVLLAAYIWQSVRWSRAAGAPSVHPEALEAPETVKPAITLAKLVVGVALVVVASQVLIPTVEETALRLRIPDAIIAATLVAFGTSLPELVTAITAVRKGHGELALGNIIGADILNVLFVTGAAATVTPGGLAVPPKFFQLFFPALIIVVTVLCIGISRSTYELRRGFGFVLLGAYVVTVVAGYLIPGMDAGVGP